MAVFACDRNAVIQDYNQRPVELWGREPQCGVERHCGSVKLYLPNGIFLPERKSTLSIALRDCRFRIGLHSNFNFSTFLKAHFITIFVR